MWFYTMYAYNRLIVLAVWQIVNLAEVQISPSALSLKGIQKLDIVLMERLL